MNSKKENVSRREMITTSTKATLTLLMLQSLPFSLKAGLVKPYMLDRLNGHYRLKSINNLLNMGHCAPAVIRSLLEILDAEDNRMVKAVAGMPGGIANLGAECGGLTSALMVLSLYLSDDQSFARLPVVITTGDQYIHSFQTCHGNLNCHDLQQTGGIKACIDAVCKAPELLSQTLLASKSEKIGNKSHANANRSKIVWLSHFRESGFHCVHDTLRHLGDIVDLDDKTMAASWCFLGGTLLNGKTCGALTAGVLAIGLKVGEIENSYLRVFKMIRLMMKDGDAMNNQVNKFNRSINLGNELASWFQEQYGCVDCAGLHHCDITMEQGVKEFITSDQVSQCRQISMDVSQKVREILSRQQKPTQS